MESQIHVIVTTSYKGVFYGQMSESELKEETITLHNANNVMYWVSETKGFLGLSSNGPAEGSKIGAMSGGPVVLHKITSISQCSEKAIKVWEQYQK